MRSDENFVFFDASGKVASRKLFSRKKINTPSKGIEQESSDTKLHGSPIPALPDASCLLQGLCTPTYSVFSSVHRLRDNAYVGPHRPCKQDLSGVHKQQHSCRPSFLCQLQPQNNATERGRTPQNNARERTWRTSFLPLLPAPRYPTTLPHTALPSMPSCALSRAGLTPLAPMLLTSHTVPGRATTAPHHRHTHAHTHTPLSLLSTFAYTSRRPAPPRLIKPLPTVCPIHPPQTAQVPSSTTISR